jgi:hypothetical protein
MQGAAQTAHSSRPLVPQRISFLVEITIVRALVEDSRAADEGQRDKLGGALGRQSVGRATAQLGCGWRSALPLLQVEARGQWEASSQSTVLEVEEKGGAARQAGGGAAQPRSKRRTRGKVRDD